jgi:DNA repair protein RadC
MATVDYTAAPVRPRRRGDAAILRAMAILERRLREPGEALGSPGQVRAFLMLHLAELEHESFGALFLDAQNRLIEYRELFRGTLTQTSVYPREVVKTALRLNAGAVILAHNHPSHLCEPSPADEVLTGSLKLALAMVDVKILDHFIVAGRGSPLSFAERGLL